MHQAIALMLRVIQNFNRKKLSSMHLFIVLVSRYDRYILSPMTRGSLGTISLNRTIQESSNPYREGKRQLKVGERI